MIDAIKPYLEKKYPFVSINPNPADHSCDNLVLYTATWYHMGEFTEMEEITTKTILYCMFNEAGLVRYPGTYNFSSYDDLIGYFVFLEDIYADESKGAKAMYDQLNNSWWRNGNVSVWRFFHMRALAKWVAYRKTDLFSILFTSACFIQSMFEPKAETSGKCMLMLIKDTMLGASHILDFVMKLWAKKMTKMYGERGEVYRIYFENPGVSNNPCFRLYTRKDF